MLAPPTRIQIILPELLPRSQQSLSSSVMSDPMMKSDNKLQCSVEFSPLSDDKHSYANAAEVVGSSSSLTHDSFLLATGEIRIRVRRVWLCA